MAYGRLDVYGPEGFFETFSLEGDNISIGRSTGNTITLDTNTISRYHFSLTHDGDKVFITDLDSVNGTFVDGLKLEANERRSMHGGEEIQIGHLRMIYHHLDDMPTQPIMAEETTQRIELQLPTFRMDIQGPDQAVSPGAHISSELMITNTSSAEEKYSVEVTGPPPEWVRVNRPTMTLKPEEAAEVVISFKPLRRPDSKPGDYPVKVRVRPDSSPESLLEANVTLRILAYSGFGIALETRRISSGQRFRLHLHNQGSAPLPLTISGRDLSEHLRFVIPTPQVTLGPGQRMTVLGEVHPRSPALYGNISEHLFDLVVRCHDPSGFLVAVRGRFVERPMLPAWSPVLAGAGILAALALFVLAMVLILRPNPEPRIANFEVGSTQIAQGTPLALSWAVTDVAQLSVNVNGTPELMQVDPRTSGTQLDTSDLYGEVIVSILGTNGNRQDSASQTVQVYRPMTLETFAVEPQQLVRYVVQPMTIRWNVPGADFTQIHGLENFTVTPVATTYEAEGEIADLVGIPLEAVTITLFAQDEVGNSITETFSPEMVTPECAPSADAVTLYTGPDERQQVVGTIPAGVSVVVDAQDDSGQWLRAQLTGGVSGWGARSAFTCAATFNVDDLRKEVNVPMLPTPTLTFTPPPPTITAAPISTGTTTPTS
jgi:pSer/pThr/pTyr-binding forkhead associated (FHA) protein